MTFMHARVIDSTHLELAEPICAEQGAQLIISVADSQENKTEREAWIAASLDGLQAAYGDHEPEYPADLVKETNPEYKA